MKYLIAYIAGVVTFLLALAVCNRSGVQSVEDLEEWGGVKIDPKAYEPELVEWW